MTVFLHEMKRAKVPLLIWSAALAFMMAVTVFVFPQMADQMAQMEDLFANMGSFSAAFGMDKLSFARFTDYFAVECGNVLGLGGSIFAAITGAKMLSKEEKDHTAEFLYTHPLSRSRIVLEKLLALAVQIVIVNAAVTAVSLGAAAVIGETAEISVLLLLFLAYLLLGLQIGLMCFGISAFLRSGIGAALGLAIGLYFVNILSNITEDLKPLKYITPFAYTDGAKIIADHAIPAVYLLIGAGVAAVCTAAAFIKTNRKDFAG